MYIKTTMKAELQGYDTPLPYLIFVASWQRKSF